MAAVTQQQIDELRSSYETKLQQDSPPSEIGSFHPHDLERLKDDNFLRRFLEHHDNDIKLATQMIWDALVWRKSFGANEITEDNIAMDYMMEGAFFCRGKDINGRPLLVFKAVKHKKGIQDSESLKRCIIYWLDRLERSESNQQITLFFDMEGAGLSNMDMEVIKYIIGTLKHYYPNFINYIVIYEMAWVLNAAFKVVKTLLPAKAVAKMRFLNKTNVKEIVPLDQALKCWGGQDDYEFKFEPEVRTIVAPANESGIKKVTFAESDQVNSDNSDSKNSEIMIALNPPHIAFTKSGNEVTSTFTITNNNTGLITYKIKTTSPEKFRVRPNIGMLATGVSQTINIIIQQGYLAPPLTFGGDKFLVMCMPLINAEVNSQELAELWKNAPSDQIEQHRLRCSYQNAEIAKNGIIRQNSLGDGDKQSIHISQSLTDLKEAHRQMRTEMKTLKMLTLITLSTTLFIMMAMFYMFQNTSNQCVKE